MQSNPVVRRRRALRDDADAEGRGALNAATGQEIWKFDPERRRGARARIPPSRRHRPRRSRVRHLSQLPVRARQANRPADPVLRPGRPHRSARGPRNARRARQRQRQHARRDLRGPARSWAAACRKRCPARRATSARSTSTPASCVGSSHHPAAGRVRLTTRWPPDAYKLIGGANAWAGVTVDAKHAMVFAATGSASFDFYGVNRHGDNLFAELRARARRAAPASGSGISRASRHDVWDWDFPAAPNLRDGQAQRPQRRRRSRRSRSSGYVYVLDRRRGEPLFPIEQRARFRRRRSTAKHGCRTAAVSDRSRRRSPGRALTEAMLDDAHAGGARGGARAVPAVRIGDVRAADRSTGIIVFPGFDGGAEWGGAAFDPDSALLYVNSNEMPWIVRLIPQQRHVALQQSTARPATARTAKVRRPRRRSKASAIAARATRSPRIIREGHRADAGVSRHGRAQHRRPRRVPRSPAATRAPIRRSPATRAG